MAAERKLWICLSGPSAAKQRAQPVLQSMGQGVFDFGEAPGAANLVKLGGNFVSFAAALAMREVLISAKKNGLDPTSLIEMLTNMLFPIAVFQYHGKKMAVDPEHFSGTWIALKDTSLFKEAAQKAGAMTPIADLLHSLLAKDSSVTS